MIKKSVLKEIDRVIKEIWVKDIAKDYENNYLLREDSLKCALYYHMRRKLDKILKENSLRIYPEFYIKELKYRADIVIVEIDEASEKNHLKDWVTDIVIIMELKFECGQSKGAIEAIKRDIEKAKCYLKKGALDCQCYLAIIYEEECKNLSWMNKHAINNWANGNVTELNAGLMEGTMCFEVNSY